MEPEHTTHATGDTVRVNLPDPDGPDAKYNGRTATVVEVDADGLGDFPGAEEDWSEMYTLEFDDGERPSLSFRVHDLEPVNE